MKNYLKGWLQDWWSEGAEEILKEYHARMGIPYEGNVVQVHQDMEPMRGPLIVRIRLDGYKVEFEHNEDYSIPPPSQWVRM